MRTYRLSIFFALLTTTFGSLADPTDTQLKLAKQYVALLDLQSVFSAYLKQCIEGTTFDPDYAYSANPQSFGGITPRSAYWPEIKAIYRNMQQEACAYMSADEFSDFMARQYAKNSADDLRAAIAFYSSPAGRRIEAFHLQANEAFQAYARGQLNIAYRVAYDKAAADLSAIGKKYKDNPR